MRAARRWWYNWACLLGSWAKVLLWKWEINRGGWVPWGRVAGVWAYLWPMRRSPPRSLVRSVVGSGGGRPGGAVVRGGWGRGPARTTYNRLGAGQVYRAY